MIFLNKIKCQKSYASILLVMVAGLLSPTSGAQSQSDKNLCENFSSIGFQNAQLRDQGKSQEQIIAHNSRYIADVMNRNNVFQDYLSVQAKTLFTEEYLNLKPEQIKQQLYNNCINIFN